MTVLALWNLAKAVGPWIGGGLLAAALGALVADRDHLAALNQRHQACLAAVQGKPAAQPLDQACEAPIAAAVEQAAAGAACNHALETGDPFAASQACSGPTKRLIADRNAKASEAANLLDQLHQAAADRDAAVARARARATASAQGLTHAQSVLAAAPRDGDGLSVCDADCLRQLAGAAAR